MSIGSIEQFFVYDGDIDSLYKDRVGDVTGSLLVNLPPNTYCLLKSEINAKKSIVVCHLGGNRVRTVPQPEQKLLGATPRDMRQLAFVDSLLSPTVRLAVGLGAAGTGKSYLAIAYALGRLSQDAGRVLLCRPATYVGTAKAFGAVPGTVQEKYAPFIESFNIVMQKLLGERSVSYLQMMQKREQIQFLPLEFTRGCTYDNATFIIDEAQNTTWHEMNSLVTRMGENTKLIVLGDPSQIDTKVPSHETGLYQLVHSMAFANSPITSVVELVQQYRSPMAQLAIEINKEIVGEHWT